MFTPTNNNQKYCNDKHYRPCPICGKPVEVKHAGDLKNNIFRTCSKKCENLYISQKLKSHNSASPKYSKCVVCGQEFQLQHPYTQKTCSPKCRGIYRKESGIAKLVYEKSRQTNLVKYGKENPGQVPDFIAKRDAKCKQLYGDSKVLRLKKFQLKSKSTVKLHYGVDHPMRSDDVKAKLRATMKSKYGVDNYAKTREYMLSTISDPSKLDNWLSFKCDPISYIKQKFTSRPNISDLVANLGVTDTRIYDILIEFNAQSYISHYSSIIESEVVDYIQSIDPSITIIHNDRCQILPYELDIYLPELRFAIECNPAITHNSSIPDQFGGEPKSYNYHKMKTDMCEKVGIQLFHIFGYEWELKQDIIKSMLRNKLNQVSRIYARRCYVRDCTYLQTREFLMNNHRQGFSSYKYSIGLFDKQSDNLVSIMTFGKLRNSQGKRSDDTTSIELVRFCNLCNTTVVGGASKLFKYFISHHPEYTKVVSFSDRAHTCGKLYDVLGFHQVNLSSPGYFWSNLNDTKIYNRVSCRKSNLRKLFNDDTIDIEHKTEKEIMIEHGYVQIFDSGVIRWEWSNHNQ